MKYSPAFLAFLALAGSPAMTQTAPASPATATAKHYTTGDTPIGTLLADPAAKAIVDKHIPGFSQNPQIGVVANATLLQIQPMKPDTLSDAVLAAIDSDLNKLPAK